MSPKPVLAIALLLLAGCQRQLPDDAPSSNSVGLVPAAPKALGARAATLQPLPEPEMTPEPSGEPEEDPELELGAPESEGGVPL